MSLRNNKKLSKLTAQRKKLEYAVGKYSEVRSIYSAKQFSHHSLEGDENRTIHLGIDIFAKEGTSFMFHSMVSFTS